MTMTYLRSKRRDKADLEGLPAAALSAWNSQVHATQIQPVSLPPLAPSLGPTVSPITKTATIERHRNKI